jgi:phenylpropionate dioxygenase-like ring-hydroxylating dioxygenase large terminal subunit
MLTDDRRAAGVRLADGTPLGDLIDLDQREVSMRLLWDREIYDLELDRLFARAWMALAHESEIPDPGDYVTRSIGEDQVVVQRDHDGEINVLLNVCRHRGMPVCRAEAGNTGQWRCPYHGWTYDDRGRFLGAPVAKEQMWGDVLPKSELGLRRARVGMYAGMVFATFDETAPSLSEYLGDITWYIDMVLSRTDEGLEVAGPPQRLLVPANWKTAGEQFAGDGYHTLGLHRSLLEMGVLTGEMSADASPGMYGVDVSVMGHGVRCIPFAETFQALAGQWTDDMSPMEKLRLVPPSGVPPHKVDDLETRFSPAQLRVLTESPPTVAGIFPNNACLNFYSPMPDGLGVSLGWHTFVPRGPEHFEFLTWVFVPKGMKESADLNKRSTIFGTGTSGVVEQDDSEAWPQIQRSAHGALGRRQTLKYHALLGENKGDWPGPGKVYGGFSKDDNQWEWWLRWLEFMTEGAW